MVHCGQSAWNGATNDAPPYILCRQVNMVRIPPPGLHFDFGGGFQLEEGIIRYVAHIRYIFRLLALKKISL